MGDITQLSDADLAALSRQQQLAAIPTEHLEAAVAQPPATAADRVQAGEAGILKGGAYLAGMIPDVLPNLKSVGTAGADAFRHYVMGTDWADLPRPNEPFPVSRAITGVMDKSPITTTQLARPDDTASRYLSTAGSALLGGPRAIGPALAGQYIGESTNSPTASILAQALGTAMTGRPRGQTEVPGAAVRNQTVREGQAAGMVFPPATTNPTSGNRIVESIAGKQRVQQHAQLENRDAVNEGARADLKLPGEGAISEDELARVNKQTDAPYTAMRQVGPVQTGSDPNFVQTLSAALSKYTGAGRVLSNAGDGPLRTDITDILSKPSADAGDLLDTIGVLRDRSKSAFKNGDNGIGAAYRQTSNALENQLGTALPPGSPLLADFQAARQTKAIVHTIEDARNEGTGDINAQKLAAMLHNDVPLQGNLLTAAKAAGVAKQAFAPVENSKGVSHLGILGTMFAGAAFGHEMMPGHAGAILGAVPGGLAAARVGAQKYALGPGQKNAIAYQRELDPRVLAAALASGAARQ